MAAFTSRVVIDEAHILITSSGFRCFMTLDIDNSDELGFVINLVLVIAVFECCEDAQICLGVLFLGQK